LVYSRLESSDIPLYTTVAVEEVVVDICIVGDLDVAYILVLWDSVFHIRVNRS
jgi:hypothetical protein